MPAMDLHGDFAGSELKRNLLIEHARNYQSHDFALAWGQRFSLHLPHHMPAMDLHGDFAGSELKRNLLIEHARNYQSHDFALAWGERFVVLSQLAKFALLLTRCPIAIQSLMNRIQQILVPEWLGQELDRAGFHGLYRHRNISMAGDKDDGNPDSGVNQLALKIQTVDSGKSHVQDQAAWPVRPLAA